MLKLFFRLYLLLGLVLGLYLGAVGLYSGSLLKTTIADYLHAISRGTYTLVMRRLIPLPRAQWPAEVKRIGAEFGYPIALVERASIELPAPDLDRLRRGLALPPDLSSVEPVGKESRCN